MVRDYLIFILLAFSSQGISQELKWAAPRTQYVKLQASWLVSNRHFDSDGTRQDNIVEYGFYGIRVYGESKIGKRLVMMFKVPFNIVYTELTPNNRNASTNLLGDIDLGASYHIIKDSLFLLTGSVILGIPLKKHEFTAVMTGDHEFNQLIMMETTKSVEVGHSSGFLSLYSGYNHRSLGYADEIQYGASASAFLAQNNLRLSLSLDGIKSLGLQENAKFINPTSLFSNYKEYLRLTPKINYYFNAQWGMMLSTSIHVSGKNFITEPIFSIGITRRKTFPQKDEVRG